MSQEYYDRVKDNFKDRNLILDAIVGNHGRDWKIDLIISPLSTSQNDRKWDSEEIDRSTRRCSPRNAVGNAGHGMVCSYNGICDSAKTIGYCGVGSIKGDA